MIVLQHTLQRRMSLRTRLIFAFLLLSVLPLTAVTLLSYRASVAAFERAAQREATERATDVTRRMESVTADLGQRMDRMFVASTPMPEAHGRPDPEKLRAALAPILGETAALVDRVEFRPEAPAPPAPPAAGAQGGAPAPPQPPAAPRVIVMDVPALVEQSLRAGLAGAGQSIAAVAEALANREAEALRGDAEKPSRVDVQGRQVEVAVRKDGKLLGKANATLNLDRTLKTVLAFTQGDQGEIPFAIDRRGKLYTPKAADMPRLQQLGVQQLAPRAADGPVRRNGEWIIVAKRDAGGIIFGIARPIGQSLREIRRTSVRNLGLGFGVIALAVIGIIPISGRMTRHLSTLTAGAHRIAEGDFNTRVTVKSNDEFGSLAAAFNQMAADLERHQSLVIEQERLRRELELSRQIQTEMLPRGPLRSDAAEIAGVSIPAREVGGDFFNYFDLPGGESLALLVGDVSGKGISAALLMANAQATLRARLPLEQDLALLADSFDRELDRNTPRAVYLTLFIGILEPRGRSLRYVNAGHNPQFLVRKRGGIERLSSTGLPIALYAGHGYAEAHIDVEEGDLLFFYTDGLVEAENVEGEMFGTDRLEALLAGAGSRDVAAVLHMVEQKVHEFTGDVEPLDDATMMALRVTS